MLKTINRTFAFIDRSVSYSLDYIVVLIVMAGIWWTMWAVFFVFPPFRLLPFMDFAHGMAPGVVGTVWFHSARTDRKPKAEPQPMTREQSVALMAAGLESGGASAVTR